MVPYSLAMSAAPALLPCLLTPVARWTCIHVTERATWLVRSFESFRLDLARQARQYEQVVLPVAWHALHNTMCAAFCSAAACAAGAEGRQHALPRSDARDRRDRRRVKAREGRRAASAPRCDCI